MSCNSSSIFNTHSPDNCIIVCIKLYTYMCPVLCTNLHTGTAVIEAHCKYCTPQFPCCLLKVAERISGHFYQWQGSV